MQEHVFITPEPFEFEADALEIHFDQSEGDFEQEHPFGEIRPALGVPHSVLLPPSMDNFSFRRGHDILEDQTTAWTKSHSRGLLREIGSEFSFSSFPNSILDALRKGLESVAVRLAVAVGYRDENTLTNLVFFSRHPEQVGRKLVKGEPGFSSLSEEWLNIRNLLVRPALKQQPHIPTTPASSTDVVPQNLKWGVPDGIVSDPFYRNKTEAQQLYGISGRSDGDHLGIDVTGPFAGKAPRTLHDLRRGLPVYATIKQEIAIVDLNGARVKWGGNKATPSIGLGISGRGTARLENAMVLQQPWITKKPENVIRQWGGILGFACLYSYEKLDGSRGSFTLYIEYLHLITENYPPINKSGNRLASPQDWIAIGKKLGFGSRMKDRNKISAQELTGGEPLLVGYLGATQSPHVHINASYRTDRQAYSLYPRFDPTVMIT